VYIHPFAEEMNKARRMAALQSRALAAAGFSVLQIDLQGCGDSSGDFDDASWQAWIEDIVQGCAWLRAQDPAHADAPLWLWGLRAGCLLAVAAAPRLQSPCNFCFWQPAPNGKLVLQQFLRLKVAADMLAAGNKGLMEQMRRELAENITLDIAGYRLAPALAQGLEQAQLIPPRGQGRMVLFELSGRDDALLSPVQQKLLEQWNAAAYHCQAQLVSGPSFWQTTEIEDAPALIAATVDALCQGSVAA
jgi:exosortase A-associated hydrolase 2